MKYSRALRPKKGLYWRSEIWSIREILRIQCLALINLRKTFHPRWWCDEHEKNLAYPRRLAAIIREYMPEYQHAADSISAHYNRGDANKENERGYVRNPSPGEHPSCFPFTKHAIKQYIPHER